MPDAATEATLDLPAGAAPAGDSATLAFDPSAAGASATEGVARAGGGPRPFPKIEGYEIEKELGRGGMGVVYLARQTALGRKVALKMVLAGGAAGPDQLARFRAEAQAVAKLQHPNIVQIHEVGQHDGAPFLSLEYVAGGGLDQALAGAPLPPGEAAALAETLARAMHYAHGQGVVHRDLKPANVLLSGSVGERERGSATNSRAHTLPRSNAPTPKITDFGLAKQLEGDSGQTKSGAILGTPSYMAPEQAGGKKEVGPPADVYALGAILYELLTGRPPFRAASALDTLLQVVEAEPVPPRRLQPKTPLDLETICLKCLEKEPKKRYADAAALADDLRRFQEGKPTEARAAGLVERGAKWVRRNPRAALRLAVALVAALGLFAYREESRARLADEKDRSEQRRLLALKSQETAERERKRAEQHLTKAIAALDQMVFRAADGKMAQLPQMQEERKQLLERAAAFYQGFLAEEASDPRLRREMGRAYLQLARLHQGLGEEAKAKEFADQAAELQRELLAAAPDSHQLQFDLAEAQIVLGALASTKMDMKQALVHYGDALARLDRLCGADPANLDYQERFVETCQWSGYFNIENQDKAEQFFRQAVGRAEAAMRQWPDEPRLRLLAGAAHTHFGYLHLIRQRFAEAEPLLARGLAELAHAGEEAVPFRSRHILAVNYAGQGYLALGKRQRAAARAKLEKAVAYFEEALAAQPKAFHLLMHASRAYDALVPFVVGDPDERKAEQTLRRAMALHDRLHEHYPAFRQVLSQRATINVLLQIYVARRGDHRAAVAVAGGAEAAEAAGKNVNVAYNQACVYAQALAALRKEATLSAGERQALEGTYATEAFRWLEKAKELGYFKPPGRLDAFKRDTDLDPLRGLPAHTTFVEGIGK